MELSQRECHSHTFSLFSPPRPSLPPSLPPRAPCSPLVFPSVRLCQRSKRFSSLCRNSPSLSSRYLFILRKLKCGEHTLMEEYESGLTALYKPQITSHHSKSSHQTQPLIPPPLTCCLFSLYLDFTNKQIHVPVYVAAWLQPHVSAIRGRGYAEVIGFLLTFLLTTSFRFNQISGFFFFLTFRYLKSKEQKKRIRHLDQSQALHGEVILREHTSMFLK